VTNSEIRLLQAVHRSGAGEPVSVTLSVSTTPPMLVATVGGEGLEPLTGAGIQACLINLRRRLEARGLLLCCQGARLNVWPSGMLRDWTLGQRAYVLARPVTGEGFEEVDVLDPAPSEQVVTVDEQIQFLEGFYGMRFRRTASEDDQPATGT
jgi:hypothetical protein